jgi:hypothetical protein
LKPWYLVHEPFPSSQGSGAAARAPLSKSLLTASALALAAVDVLGFIKPSPRLSLNSFGHRDFYFQASNESDTLLAA